MFDFRVGDTVVEPTLGICNIEGIRRMTIDGKEEDYFVFQSINAKVLVPRSQLARRGIRKPMTRAQIKKLHTSLRVPTSPVRGDARQMYLNYREVIKSGDPQKICKLLRDLHVLAERDELKGKEKEIMEQAKGFLADEIVYVTEDSKTKVRADLDGCLEKMYKKKLDKDAKSESSD